LENDAAIISAIVGPRTRRRQYLKQEAFIVAKNRRRGKGQSRAMKNGHVPVSDGKPESGIFDTPIADIKPAIINDVVYGVTDPDDPHLDELVRLLAVQGQLEPVVVTLDGVLLSGHRRRGAAIRLGWRTLKARHHPIYSTDPQFEKVLVSYNAQRDKSPAVRIHEQLVLTDPEDAYGDLVSERAKASRVNAETLTLGAGRGRSRITSAKQPFLEAIKRVIDELKDYWPLSDRRVHYSLLNDPPLIHARKHNRYRNDKASYKATCELLTRARLTGLIPFDAIGDDTRPNTNWNVFPNVSPYFRGEVRTFAPGTGGICCRISQTT
jgi:hypothetical protein